MEELFYAIFAMNLIRPKEKMQTTALNFIFLALLRIFQLLHPNIQASSKK